MSKKPTKYLQVDPHKIIEDGYHSNRHQVSESLFSISNEYLGVRGYFEEGISDAKSLKGVYFNGIYDYSREVLSSGYKGMVNRTHFMVNAIDFFKITLDINHEKLDLSKVKFTHFYRSLSFDSGEYVRKFTWHLKSGGAVSIEIKRLLSMLNPHLAFQEFFLSSPSDVKVSLRFQLDNQLKQWGGDSYFSTAFSDAKEHLLVSKTTFSNQKIYTRMKVVSDIKESAKQDAEGSILYKFKLAGGQTAKFTRHVVNLTSRDYKTTKPAIKQLERLMSLSIAQGYDYFYQKNIEYYKKLNASSDIEIVGNDEDLQGIRYCTFMMNSTYHGFSSSNNLGAKGLTGEAYSGHAFWDSETYCLPFFLFNNPKAAKDLIIYRYHTLGEAKKRAIALDCRGAAYPIATLNGEEGCTLWQHASLQPQPTSGVNYAIFHYYNVTKDKPFILNYGLEILANTCLFLLDRGQYNQDNSKFGYYGVMGPDEFKMMVNNNAYTNIMGKFSFDLLAFFLKLFEKDNDYQALLKRLNLDKKILKEMALASEKMDLKFDSETLLFEQNDGFFDLPHIDINAIPQGEFPLYSHWTYDRIYRGDMIKQPDVLMFLFLFNSYYSKEIKQANYEFYEQKTIHESSLSPSIHSIFAEELGKNEEAMRFFGYASRLDLDDYNNNTHEGIHLTSMAAAWMNIVYGFGGFRSDGPHFKLAPSLPSRWKSFSFKLNLNNTLIKVTTIANKVVITREKGLPLLIEVYGKLIKLQDTYETNINK